MAVMSGPEAAFVSLVSSPFVPSTTHFAATKASPSVLPIPCRYARQRTFNITASHAAETKPRSADPKTVDTSRFASTGKFNFDGTEFRNSVSGEWFGYQVTFSAKTGAAQNIEERFVPEEFRNWDVDITGFDCLTSSTVKDDNLLLKVTRALPTVGCEADAIVPDVDELEFSAIDTETDTRNGGFSDGSFTAGPSVFTGTYDQRWSATLADGSDVDARRRARVSFGRVEEGIGSIVVWLERRDGAYSGGSVLPGCGGPDSSFASAPRTTPDDLSGNWHILRTVLSKRTEWEPEEFTEQIRRGTSDLQPFFSLPCGLSLSIISDSQGTVVESAWLSSPHRRTVVRRVYAKSGTLEAIEHAIEKEISENTVGC